MVVLESRRKKKLSVTLQRVKERENIEFKKKNETKTTH